MFYGGSVALIAIYAAFGAVLLRKKAMAYWRPFHALMYVALFFGVVHANLAGMDLQNMFIMIIYDALFAGVVAAFVLKRWQFHRIRARKNNSVNHQK
jgi:DMSO/TMAO reductase YedYZ heme-binding membrane subunit